MNGVCPGRPREGLAQRDCRLWLRSIFQCLVLVLIWARQWVCVHENHASPECRRTFFDAKCFQRFELSRKERSFQKAAFLLCPVRGTDTIG